MKIVSWNCGGAFRNKFTQVLNFNADVYIIQECEDPARVLKKPNGYDSFTKNHLWVGDNKNKGLGVFAREGVIIDIDELNLSFNDMSLKWFLPFTINHQKIIAAWSHRGDVREYRYIGQFWCLLKKNKAKLRNTIIAGDFNSNAVWDYKRIECTHTNCVKELQEIDIVSLYHSIHDVSHGMESIYTFFMHKNEEKRYHIDYFFVPRALVHQTKQFTIEPFHDWTAFSDHVPLVWEY